MASSIGSQGTKIVTDRRYRSAQRFQRVVQLRFDVGDMPMTVTVPLQDGERLMADLVNILRDVDHLEPVDPQDIGLAIRQDLDTETRVTRKVHNIDVERPEDAAHPTILRIVAGTETGPMALRITQIAAQELAHLIRRPVPSRKRETLIPHR